MTGQQILPGAVYVSAPCPQHRTGCQRPADVGEFGVVRIKIIYRHRLESKLASRRLDRHGQRLLVGRQPVGEVGKLLSDHGRRIASFSWSRRTCGLSTLVPGFAAIFFALT